MKGATGPRVILLTGANNGIGLAMALALAARGHQVAALDLTGENLLARAAVRPDCLTFYPCDVTDPPRVAEVVTQVVRRWGRVDILVNNAALALFSPLTERKIEGIRQEFEVNYFGSLNLIQAVLPHMLARGQGIIHNVSSGVGLTGFPGLTGYASTKGALEALTRTLDLELAPRGVRANLLHPPLTNTRSARPLGIPAAAMADPVQVGRRLAEQVGKVGPVLTPDLQTRLFLFFVRRYPEAVGRLLARLTERARQTREGDVS